MLWANYENFSNWQEQLVVVQRLPCKTLSTTKHVEGVSFAYLDAGSIPASSTKKRPIQEIDSAFFGVLSILSIPDIKS